MIAVGVDDMAIAVSIGAVWTFLIFGLGVWWGGVISEKSRK